MIPLLMFLILNVDCFPDDFLMDFFFLFLLGDWKIYDSLLKVFLE